MTRLGAAKKRARQRLRPVVVRLEPTPDSYVGGLALVQEKRDARARRLVGQFLQTIALGLAIFAVVFAMLGGGE